MGLVGDGGADRLSRGLANLPGRQAAVLIFVEFPVHMTSCLERVLDKGVSLEACERVENGIAVGVRVNPRSTGSSEGTIVIPEGVPG